MQIIQFLVGASYAALHSFVSYTIPVQVPDLASSVENVASAATTAVSSAATVATSAGFANLLKKLLFQAAGKEGLAETVNGVHPGGHVAHGSSSGAIQYHTEYRTVQCIDTSGQTFAIWFNVLYLTPLTALFVRFFVKSYLQRSQKGAKGSHSTKHGAAEKAGKDALKGAEREIYTNGSANGHANGHANGKANGKH
jgi:hypothetical protein